MNTLLIILIVLLLLGGIGTFPTWPHARAWGYGPSGGLMIAIVVILIFLLVGRR